MWAQSVRLTIYFYYILELFPYDGSSFPVYAIVIIVIAVVALIMALVVFFIGKLRRQRSKQKNVNQEQQTHSDKTTTQMFPAENDKEAPEEGVKYEGLYQEIEWNEAGEPSGNKKKDVYIEVARPHYENAHMKDKVYENLQDNN